MKKTIVIGILGSTLDVANYDSPNRWNKWRPNVNLAMHDDLRVDRFELIHGARHNKLGKNVREDIERVSPDTQVNQHIINLKDPWDFEEVYGELLNFTQNYPFDPDNEEYLIHITTGTHVAQICLFLLTEARFLPGKLIQTQPKGNKRTGISGKWNVIDLDLSRYDSIASRFAIEHATGTSFLKSGIETLNAAFNDMIAEIEHVAIRTSAPILLTGPTGAGKSQLANKIYQLKKARHQLEGQFVEVNCATLRGDSAMSALFGHKKGAFTGAASERAGLLKAADKGMLFLDEIGELGLDEQAMILRAIEEKRFLPVGADKESQSDFQLMAGTNQNLTQAVKEGKFRDDLLARLNIWTYSMPGLYDRREDIEPNIDYELDRYAEREGDRVSFNKEARQQYLSFATSSEASWAGNFRDLSSSITRMATLSLTGRIDIETVHKEIIRLKQAWSNSETSLDDNILMNVLGSEKLDKIDLFDHAQLVEVIKVCRQSKSLSEAGRSLFAASRKRRNSSNDADRLSKYLAKFGLSWTNIQN